VWIKGPRSIDNGIWQRGFRSLKPGLRCSQNVKAGAFVFFTTEFENSLRGRIWASYRTWGTSVRAGDGLCIVYVFYSPPKNRPFLIPARSRFSPFIVINRTFGARTKVERILGAEHVSRDFVFEVGLQPPNSEESAASTILNPGAACRRHQGISRREYVHARKALTGRYI